MEQVAQTVKQEESSAAAEGGRLVAVGFSASATIDSLIQEHGYKVSVPDYVCYLPGKLTDIKCPECPATFKGISSGLQFKDRKFFLHCVLYCERYQESGRIRCCSECKLIFLNGMYRSSHMETHRSPQAVQKRQRRASLSSP